MNKKLFFVFFLILVICAYLGRDLIDRLYQGFQMNRLSKKRVALYLLSGNQDIQDITDRLIAEQSAPTELRSALISGERRIIVFKYRSGGNTVAGYMSYLTKSEHPVVVFLRGGNSWFGIMRPNNIFSFLNDSNVVGTLYRGNIYGGRDDLAGDDIEDVENLMKFMPKLSAFTHKKLQPPFTMMGVSRGAMEMFDALAQSDYVKSRVNYAVSISGSSDLRIAMKKRLDMRYLFLKEYLLSNEPSLNAWLDRRDPVVNVKNIPKSVRILMVWGTSDNRVSMSERESFMRTAKKYGLKSELSIINGAGHGLGGYFSDFQAAVDKFYTENREASRLISMIKIPK